MLSKLKAGQLADSLSAEEQKVIANLGRAAMRGISEATINRLVHIKLIEKTTNILDGHTIWVLTGDGKKVQKELCGR